MSDGPYRSLPMSPKWKRAAKCAFLPSFSSPEISEALQQAAERDCRAELSEGLVRKVTALVMGPDEPALFRDSAVADLDALHRICASTMEHGLVKNAIDALHDGLIGQVALQQAAEASVSDRLLAGSRQIEEHMHRETSDSRARDTRARINEAYNGVDLSGVARILLRAPNAPALTQRAIYSGIDDGAPL